MILQNRTIYFGLGYQASSNAFTQRRNQMCINSNNNMNRYDGEAHMSRGSSIPNGYRPPYSWVLECEPKYGASVTSKADLSLYVGAGGTGIVSSPFCAGGVNGVVSLNGYGTLDSTGKLILFAIAALNGIGEIKSDSNLTGKLEAIANLVGNGELDAAIGALSSIGITLTGQGGIKVDSLATAKGFMTADITPFTPLSPQTLASNVWNSLAINYNISGTMGEKLNDAGSAANPWTENLPGSYVEGQAGYILGTSAGLTPEQIADAVWDEQTSGHQDIGSTGKALQDAGSAGNPWSSPVSGNTDPGTMGEHMAKKLLTTTKWLGLK